MCSSESFLLLYAVNIHVFLHGIISWAIKRRALMLQHFIKRTPFLSSGLSFKPLIPTQQDWVLAFLISPKRVNGRAFRLQAELRFLSETCWNISAHGMVASRIASHQVYKDSNARADNGSNAHQSPGLQWLWDVISRNLISEIFKRERRCAFQIGEIQH